MCTNNLRTQLLFHLTFHLTKPKINDKTHRHDDPLGTGADIFMEEEYWSGLECVLQKMDKEPIQSKIVFVLFLFLFIIPCNPIKI